MILGHVDDRYSPYSSHCCLSAVVLSFLCHKAPLDKEYAWWYDGVNSHLSLLGPQLDSELGGTKIYSGYVPISPMPLSRKNVFEPQKMKNQKTKWWPHFTPGVVIAPAHSLTLLLCWQSLALYWVTKLLNPVLEHRVWLLLDHLSEIEREHMKWQGTRQQQKL